MNSYIESKLMQGDMDRITWFKGKVLLPREPQLKDHYFSENDEYIPYEQESLNMGIDTVNKTITLIPASTSIPQTYDYVIFD